MRGYSDFGVSLVKEEELGKKYMELLRKKYNHNDK